MLYIQFIEKCEGKFKIIWIFLDVFDLNMYK